MNLSLFKQGGLNYKSSFEQNRAPVGTNAAATGLNEGLDRDPRGLEVLNVRNDLSKLFKAIIKICACPQTHCL
jgi:hypothetical protein